MCSSHTAQILFAEQTLSFVTKHRSHTYMHTLPYTHSMLERMVCLGFWREKKKKKEKKRKEKRKKKGGKKEREKEAFLK